MFSGEEEKPVDILPTPQPDPDSNKLPQLRETRQDQSFLLDNAQIPCPLTQLLVNLNEVKINWSKQPYLVQFLWALKSLY